MAKWSADSGILRKKPPEKHDDLLVFGYACKLFRDDEKAQYVDQGRHLIPWMGDEKLKIDRYDCRGALSDLSSCEASREGYDAMRWLGLSDSERRLEQLCDEERYRSLHTNEEEEELYKEEELKRLSKTNNEFQYTYDVPQKTEEGPQPKERYPDVEEEPYVAPVELDVPADIALPKTVKENARIEKTALFVSRQGPQMEILIKAKQGDNPQFAFLNRNDALYKFYRHLLNAIKTGRYKVQTDASEDEKQEEGAEQWSSQEESYLHPSLSSAAALQPAPTLPTVPYRPSADCAYSQLVNRIQGAQSSETTAAVDKSEPQTLTYEQQQYYQYYYTQQYYEYCKQVAAQRFQAGESGGAGHEDATKNNEYLQMAYAHYVQQQQQQQQQTATTPNNSYAQIVSNLNKDGPTASVLSSSNPYSALVETLQQSSAIEKAPVIYTTTSTVTTTTTKEEIKPQPTPTSVVALTTTKKPLSSLADYGSDSDGDEDDHEDVKTLPPEETRVVIDKMASYVAKNGTDFETIVKSKGDPRFNFLDDGHEFYAYYRRKIREFTDDGKDEERRTQPPPPPPSTTMTTATTTTSECNNNNNNNSKVEKKVIAPVCFSIKKPKDEPAKDIKSALPVEESSDEEASETPTVVGTVTTTPPIITSDVAPVIESDEAKNGIFDVDDPILEMIDLTDDLEERKDAKRAEDRIKDKLAAAAREKLASVSRDRALQLERRKKAAAFLKLKSVETTTTTATTTTPTTPPPTADRKKKRRRSEDERKRRKRQPEESDVEEGEIRKRKHKKSHKRKRAKSKGRKKSKKRRRRSESRSSRSSHST